MEFVIDDKDYKRFEKFVSDGGLERGEALRLVLIKGMQAYWPQQLAEMASGYTQLKIRIEEYRRDNEILNSMHSQNFELRELLSQKEEAAGGA